MFQIKANAKTEEAKNQKKEKEDMNKGEVYFDEESQKLVVREVAAVDGRKPRKLRGSRGRPMCSAASGRIRKTRRKRKNPR